MSDWSQGSADLFAAGRTIDDPSAEDRDRLALRIAAQIAVAGGGAAVVSLATPMAAAPAAIAKVGTALSLGKVLLSLAVGVGAVTAAAAAVVVIARPPAAPVALQVRGPEPAPVPVPVPVPAQMVAADRRMESMPVPPPEPIVPAIAPAATVPVIAPAATRVAAAPVSSTSAPTTSFAFPLAEDTATEARLVRGIDDALRHHDVAAAQRLLDEHDATFPNGHFTEECAAARVLARCDGHASDDARDAACAFFARHPRSPMRTRIEDACNARCE